MNTACQTIAETSSTPQIREATLDDLNFLEDLERESFAKSRRSSRKSLRNSVLSTSQLVLIIERKDGKRSHIRMGAAIVLLYKRSLRIYSLAIKECYRMNRAGEALLRYIMNFAVSHGYERISLEADINNCMLVDWYRRFGFEPVRPLTDYYGPGESALRMVLMLSKLNNVQERMIIVVDDVKQVSSWSAGINFCAAHDYLSDLNYANSSRFQVLNLCSSHKTHSLGYYVSLLASARNHLVVPSVMNMKDATSTVVAQSLLDEIKDYIEGHLQDGEGDDFELTVILGKTVNPRHKVLARKLFALFSIPFFTLYLQRREGWKLKKIKALSLKSILGSNKELFGEALSGYCRKRYNRPRLKHFKYDLAILVNRNELTPPSCPKALERFRKAAEKIGFYVEFITQADKHRICEFDALFIRETTAIENHTYGLSRHAYTEGLVVVDDPWSIMLCSNKVYLQERLANACVCQPRGWFLTRRKIKTDFLKTLPFPLVLKLPESSFSQGVFRVGNLEELKSRLGEMFKQTDLVIAQEFLISDFDWRIGLLDNKPLFACKYYMARDHWQIYNWASGDSGGFSGSHETVSVDNVPSGILKAAVNASSLIGNGLYGVDLKEINGKAYVIEVNDNPNIDAGVEDACLGDKLYECIMRSIFNRIEAERQQVRYVC